MQMKWKKIMVGTLSVCMLATCVPGVSELGSYVQTSEVVQAATEATATSGKCGKKATWKYNVHTKTLTISGTGEMENMASENCDCDGARCSTWCEKGIEENEVEKIVIGNGITKIGDRAFSKFINVKEVKIGTNVKELAGGAFWECESLKEIDLGSNIEIIGDVAFKNCKQLEKVIVGNKLKTIGKNAFWGCAALEYIELGDKLTSIGEGAFEQCGKLSKINIGKSLKTIGDRAFKECYGVKKVKIHSKNKYFIKKDNLIVDKKKTKIYWGFFDTNTTCSVDSSITKIDEVVLENPNLKSFKVNKKNKTFYSENGLLYRNKGKTLWVCPRAKKGTAVVSDKTVKIGYYDFTSEMVSAFKNCTQLKKIIIGKNVKTIDTSFRNSTALKEVEVNAKNKYFSSGKNSILSKDKSKLLEAVVVQEDGSFTVPAGVTKIATDAFSCGVTKPTHVILSDEMENFDHFPTTTEQVTLGKNYYNNGDLSFFIEKYQCEKIKSINVSEENPYYSSVDGIVYNKDQTTLLLCPFAATVCKMLDTVTSVDKNAFGYNYKKLEEIYISDYVTEMTLGGMGDNLKKIHIGKNVKDLTYGSFGTVDSVTISSENPYYKIEGKGLYTKDGSKLVAYLANKEQPINVSTGTSIIGEDAFYCNPTTEINIPSTVKTIEKNPFCHTDNLEKVTVSPDNPNYKSVDNVVYTKDGSKLVCCPEGQKGTVVICSGTAIIGENAFIDCTGKITSIMIPSTVKTIEKDAFLKAHSVDILYVPVGTKEFYKSLLTSETGFSETSGTRIEETKDVE